MSVDAVDCHQRRPRRQLLMSELRRAAFCHPDELPEDMVSTNAKVTFRLNDGGTADGARLGPSGRPALAGAELFVLKPLGIALLDLRVGNRMLFRTGHCMRSWWRMSS